LVKLYALKRKNEASTASKDKLFDVPFVLISRILSKKNRTLKESGSVLG